MQKECGSRIKFRIFLRSSHFCEGLFRSCSEVPFRCAKNTIRAGTHKSTYLYVYIKQLESYMGTIGTQTFKPSDWLIFYCSDVCSQPCSDVIGTRFTVFFFFLSVPICSDLSNFNAIGTRE